MTKELASLSNQLSPGYSTAIDAHGGAKGRTNLAYYYPSSKEVVYLGYFHQMNIQQNYNNIRIGFSDSRIIREQSAPDVTFHIHTMDKSVWINAMGIVHRYMDYQKSFGIPSEYKGDLLGFFDLQDGSQFRFVFHEFLFTDIENSYLITDDDYSTISLKGQPSYWTFSEQSSNWKIIEESKKVDYSKTKLLEHLD